MLYESIQNHPYQNFLNQSYRGEGNCSHQSQHKSSYYLKSEKLKDEFAGKIGKEIAFLIYCLKESDCLINEPIVKTDLYKAIAEYFKVSIGSDTSINYFLRSELKIHHVTVRVRKNEIQLIQDKLDKILNSI